MARPFIPIPECVKVQLCYLLYGQQVCNVINVKVPTPAGEALLTELAIVIQSWAVTSLLPMLAHDVSLQSIKLTALDSKDAPSLTYNTGLPVSGSNNGGTPMPANVTVAAKLNSLARGRNATGRVYVPGIPSESVEGNNITGGFKTSLQNAFMGLIDAFSSTDFVWVVASYMLDKAFRTQGITNIIHSVSVDPYVDSQRRRLTGRGR